MSVMPYATVVGVFRDRSAAELAMQALINAGFKREQMRYLVADAAGGFLDNIKSVFTGLNPEEERLISNLTDMGLSSDEARYFSDEYARGSALLAIKTQGDAEMALNVLYEYGAHNAKERARFGGIMASPNRSVPPTEGPDAYAAPVYPGTLSPDLMPPQPQGAETHSTQDHQQDEATANSHVDVPSYQTQPDAATFNPQAESVETTPYENTPLPSAEESDSRAEPFAEDAPNNSTLPLSQTAASNPNTPLPREIASSLDAPFPQETSNNINTPLPQEVASNSTLPFPREVANDPNVPFPQEVVNNPDAPFPQETAQTPTNQLHEQLASEQEETDSVEEVVTPVYSDEQISLINPDVVEIDQIEESETPVDQANVDVYPQNSTEADTEPQSADLASSQMADSPAEQNAQEPIAENNVSTRAGELQQLLAQIETTKQQLAEARSQLEEAKQHESQLSTARLQLKELQAELQATQAELQQTHQRITG